MSNYVEIQHCKFKIEYVPHGSSNPDILVRMQCVDGLVYSLKMFHEVSLQSALQLKPIMSQISLYNSCYCVLLHIDGFKIEPLLCVNINPYGRS